MPGTPEDINERLEKIKKSGLSISIVDPSSEEAKEHCAYETCSDPITFCMESLFVCHKHAVSLMHCFIPGYKDD